LVLRRILQMRDFAAVQQNSADECNSGRDEPFSTPNLNGLPVHESGGSVDEACCHTRSNADYADNEADHRANAQAKAATKLIEIQGVPATLLTPGHSFSSPSAHPAKRGIDYELRSAGMAEIVSHRRLSEHLRATLDGAVPIGFRRFGFPMLIIEHGLPVAAFSPQRIGTHREIPNV